MTNTELLFDLLVCLLDAAQNDAPFVEVGALASALSLSSSQVASALVHLDNKGLVDAETLALTFFGLSAAATVRDSRAGMRQGRAA